MDSPSLVEKIVKEFCLKRGRVLDLGAGDGRALRKFKELGFDGVGLDIKLENSKDLVSAWDFNVFPLPFENKSFDYVFMSFSLRFVDDWHVFLRECARVLKKEGKFIVWDTQGVGVRLLDFSPFNHLVFKRYPWFAFYPFSSFLAVSEKF